MLRNAIIGIFVAACFVNTAHAVIISENLGGTANSSTGVAWGQSVTTGAGSSWNNLTFNFYSRSTPIAWGNLYLLASEYLGTPAGLASLGTELGVAAASGGLWTFDPNVTINANTTYWFYTDALLTGSLIGNNDVAGTGYYFTFSTSSDFVSSPSDINYTLTGQAVPLPATLALLGIGLAGIGYQRNSKKASM